MPLEQVPDQEAEQIANIVELTVKQLTMRYPADRRVLRGVHPKDHGCVRAKFTVRRDLPEHLRVGVLAEPGKEYEAWVRFSNAAVRVGPDSPERVNPMTGVKVREHGSRGMAIQLLGVQGTALVPGDDPLTQDFLMVNHPAFAFANVEDYQVLSQALVDNNDDPTAFFQRLSHDDPEVVARARRTATVVKRIQSLTSPPAFQPPPASPVENRYFSAAPFLFGADQVMKYSAQPMTPASGDMPNLSDPDYLRKALIERLKPGKPEVVFEFQVQLQDACEIEGKVLTEIEDATVEWSTEAYPFETVATIRIPAQEFDTPEHRAACEKLVFTPWHGVEAFRPIGGINRLRRSVYEASVANRLRE